MNPETAMHDKPEPSSAASSRSLRPLALVQTGVTVVLVVWNTVANSGVFSVTVGEISDRYVSPFTPSDYAFAIWGLIFAGLLIMTAFGVKRTFHGSTAPERCSFVAQLGWPFVTAQLCCGAWLLAWLSDWILVSLVIIVGLWLSLMSCIVRLSMERWNAPWSIIACVWWPMSLYSGWITVAVLGNLSAYLVSLDWAFVHTPLWAILLSVILSSFSVSLVWLRNMREFSAVAVWALVAVAARHTPEGPLASVFWTALAAAAVVLASSVLHAVRNFTWPPQESPRT